MTPRSIRRAQERKARKQELRNAKNLAAETNERPVLSDAKASLESEPKPRPYEFDFVEDYQPRSLSAAQLQANRANAQLSTGPKTNDGKLNSSQNAVKTALTGRTILLPGDDPLAYERHLQAFFTDHSPVGPRESDLVQSTAETWWRLKRIPVLEAALFVQGHNDFAQTFESHDPATRPSLIHAQTLIKYERQLRNLQIQESRLYRRYEKDHAELRRLQMSRKGDEIEALKQAAIRYQTAQRNHQPFDPTENGFEFSTAQIEQQVERMRAYEARLAASFQALMPPAGFKSSQAKAA